MRWPSHNIFGQEPNHWWAQCDQIGRFSKVLGEIFCFKSSPNVQWLLGYFEKHPFWDQNWFGNILDNFWKIWATFNFSIWSHWSSPKSKFLLKVGNGQKAIMERSIDQHRRRRGSRMNHFRWLQRGGKTSIERTNDTQFSLTSKK